MCHFFLLRALPPCSYFQYATSDDDDPFGGEAVSSTKDFSLPLAAQEGVRRGEEEEEMEEEKEVKEEEEDEVCSASIFFFLLLFLFFLDQGDPSAFFVLGPTASKAQGQEEGQEGHEW